MPQSAAMPSPFPPIADYAFLSNCHTGALVAPDGAIDWLCVPRFDSPSIFGTLLDREAGSFRFAPFGINVPSSPDLRARAPTSSIPPGTRRRAGPCVRDALTIGPTLHEDEVTPHTRAPADEDAHHMLVRTVLCMEGSVDMELLCEPDFDYGRTPAEWSLQDRHTADASGAGVTVRLRSSIPLGVEAEAAQARHTLQKGEQAFCSLSWAEELASPEDIDQANARMSETANYWRSWISKARHAGSPLQGGDPALGARHQGAHLHADGRDRGGALTTSLPETPGGERNWDYRFTWIRDSTFTLQALHYLNLDWEANEFMQFVGDLEPNEDGGAADHVRDRRSAGPHRVDPGRPLRIRGSIARAGRQRRLRPAPERRLRRRPRLDPAPHPAQSAPAAAAVAGRPGPGRVRDQGLEEARPGDLGGARQAPALRLLQADVLGRHGPGLAARARSAGTPTSRRSGAPPPRRSVKDILENGVRDGVLRQHYDTDALDASTLLAAIFGFLPGDDEVLRKSVLAIADDLTEDGFVLRYVTGQTDDGLVGQGGQLPDLLLLARLGSGDHRRAAARPRPDGPAAAHRLPARPLRRGVRPEHGPLPGELPPGVLASCADRGGGSGSSSASASRRSASAL